VGALGRGRASDLRRTVVLIISKVCVSSGQRRVVDSDIPVAQPGCYLEIIQLGCTGIVPVVPYGAFFASWNAGQDFGTSGQAAASTYRGWDRCNQPVLKAHPVGLVASLMSRESGKCLLFTERMAGIPGRYHEYQPT
jgi:hypothetical protein